jgi:hypothetical protein
VQVSRLVNVATFLFAEHLRGSPFLTWWYRGMVRLACGSHVPAHQAQCMCMHKGILPVTLFNAAGLHVGSHCLSTVCF